MSLVKKITFAGSILFSLLFFAAKPAAAQTTFRDELCDNGYQDCRQKLWDLIDAETREIDVAYWFMQDTSYATKIINRFNAGVKVRIIVDPRANPLENGNEQIINQWKNAGIPVRYKLTDGILHWKVMIFDAQNQVQFSGGDYSPNFFVPSTPFLNYIDEALYFTGDPSIVNSFKTKFDDVWTDTTAYGNLANINAPLTRSYPTSPINAEMNFPPSIDNSESYLNRTIQQMNNEHTKIDVIMYRITNDGFTSASIAAVQRGVPVRIYTEQNEYRNPSRPWDAYNVDNLYMNGVEIKFRQHDGLNHEKVVILYSKAMAIFGSSNWTGPSANYQAEHNYFVSSKPWFFDWFVNQFETKWNTSTQTKPFVPLPPDPPTYQGPANGATGVSTNVTLQWEGGPYAPKFDIYLGTTTNPPLYAADQFIGAIDNGSNPEKFSINGLATNTTYYWRIVSKTLANQTATSNVQSFTTSSVASQLPVPTLSSISPTAGATAGGTNITITGTNFVSGATVTIGGSPATNVAFINATTITAKTPTHTFGTVNVVVKNPDNQAGTLTNAYTFVSPSAPTVFLADDFNGNSVDTSKWVASSLFSGTTDPTVAVADSNQQLQIGPLIQNTTSSRYNGLRSLNRFDFTGAFASVQIVQPAPSNTAADAMFTIGTDVNNYYRIYVEGTNLLVQKKIAGGAKVTMLTTGFNSVNHAFWRIRHDSTTGNILFEVAPNSGGAPGTYSQLYSETWNSSMALANIQFEMKAGTFQNEANVPGTVIFDNFKAGTLGSGAAAAPTVTSITPDNGPDAGGTAVTIAGSGFSPGAVVSIGGVSATGVSVVSSTQITATTAAGNPGSADVTVTNLDGQTGALGGGYTYTAPPEGSSPPSVSSVVANTGPIAGGTAVTVSGSGFQQGAVVSFGGAFATNVVVVNDAQITCSIPTHAAGIVDVTVTNMDSQNSSLAGGFTYVSGGETVLLADNFNGSAIDSPKWIANNLFSGTTDTGVSVNVASQQLQIGPLIQNTTTSRYNGLRSASSYNFTSSCASVQVIQTGLSTTAADAMFTIGSNVSNYYRIYVEGTNLIVQKRIAGGSKVTMLTVTFNATNHAFWRIRHDSSSGNVVFETAQNNAGVPGTWTLLYSEAWNASVGLTAISFELKAGTFQNETSAPGTVIFDNFKASHP